MAELAKMKCKPCRGDEPQATPEEIDEMVQDLPDWEIVEIDGEKRLKRIFKFDDFSGALAFTDQVGKAADEEGHHPKLVTEWGKVTVSWWTHKIGGLHRNDFIMAAKTDQIYSKHSG